MASVSEDFAYLAGLLDGEGCVTYKKYWDRKRKDRPRKYFCWRIQMEIVMTHRPTIQWCADRFGGKVYEKQEVSIRCNIGGVDVLEML